MSDFAVILQFFGGSKYKHEINFVSCRWGREAGMKSNNRGSLKRVNSSVFHIVNSLVIQSPLCLGCNSSPVIRFNLASTLILHMLAEFPQCGEYVHWLKANDSQIMCVHCALCPLTIPDLIKPCP